MKLTGVLKDKVEQSKNKDEAREIIEKAGMILTEDELEKVAGGITVGVNGNIIKPGRY
ncbi:MAG: hypothetical protein K6G22_14610 [Lachnospiraceae bacterium]|nr:hypothetical protein [Lachnospiraceae bacterium]